MNQLPAAPFSKMGKPRVSILKSFTDSITKKKKTPEPSTMGGAEHEADQGQLRWLFDFWGLIFMVKRGLGLKSSFETV